MTRCSAQPGGCVSECRSKIPCHTWRRSLMPELLADETLCAKGLAVLEDHLGPVDALRFFALISRQPFDYQRWRQEHFGAMSLAEIVTQAEALSKRTQGGNCAQPSHGPAPDVSETIVEEVRPRNEL